MASTKTEELRQMDEDELDLKLAEARQELFNLRFQVVTGRLDNTARIPHVRREVARILTVQREREIAAAEALEAEAAGTHTAATAEAGAAGAAEGETE